MESRTKEFEFEYFEKYYGDQKQVEKIIEDCPNCGTKLFLSFLPDRSNLLMRETASCTHCSYGKRKLIAVIN